MSGGYNRIIALDCRVVPDNTPEMSGGYNLKTLQLWQTNLDYAPNSTAHFNRADEYNTSSFRCKQVGGRALLVGFLY